MKDKSKPSETDIIIGGYGNNISPEKLIELAGKLQLPLNGAKLLLLAGYGYKNDGSGGMEKLPDPRVVGSKPEEVHHPSYRKSQKSRKVG